MTRLHDGLRPLLRAPAVLAALAVFAYATGAHAQYQGPPRVLLLIEQQVAPPVQSQIHSVLGERLLIVPMDAYLNRAMQAGLDPGSPETIEGILPTLGVQLGIVVEYAGQDSIRLRYHDGRSGADQGTENLRVTPRGLDPAQMNLLRQMTAMRLRRSASADGDVGFDGDDSDGDDEGGGGGGSLPPADYDGQEDRPSLRGALSTGLGLGHRRLSWPARGGEEEVDAGNFLAFSVLGEAELRATGPLWMGALLNYDSSLGHTVSEQHVSGPTRDMGMRLTHLDTGLSLALDLDDEGAWVLRLALGYDLRGMRPEVHHLLSPTVTLSGPYARPELQLPLPVEGAGLRLGLQAQSVTQVSSGLTDLGAASSGTAIGVEAKLRVAITQSWESSLRFRQAHLWLDSSEGGEVSDVERYVTLQLGATL